MTTTTTAPAKATQTETFVMNGVIFTARILQTYTRGNGDIWFAVAVIGFAVNGRWYASEADDSAWQIPATCLVGEGAK